MEVRSIKHAQCTWDFKKELPKSIKIPAKRKKTFKLPFKYTNVLPLPEWTFDYKISLSDGMEVPLKRYLFPTVMRENLLKKQTGKKDNFTAIYKSTKHNPPNSCISFAIS